MHERGGALLGKVQGSISNGQNGPDWAFDADQLRERRGSWARFKAQFPMAKNGPDWAFDADQRRERAGAFGQGSGSISNGQEWARLGLVGGPELCERAGALWARFKAQFPMAKSGPDWAFDATRARTRRRFWQGSRLNFQWPRMGQTGPLMRTRACERGGALWQGSRLNFQWLRVG